MEENDLLKRISDKKNLELAYNFAIDDRIKMSHFYDPIEIALSKKDTVKQEIIDEISEILKYPEHFKPKPAFAFFPNKNELCRRKMIDIQLRDLILRYAFIIVLSEDFDNTLIRNCFANRRESGQYKKERLLENYAEISWPNFCNWQYEMMKNYSILLKTDISNFYDSISHDELIKILAKKLNISTKSKGLKLLKKMLRLKVYFYNFDNKLEYYVMKQGLAINNNTEGFLANIYIDDIDKKIQSIKNIAYGRYVDDIRIWSNDEETILEVLYKIQKLLLIKGLNLNTNKTKIFKNDEAIKNFIKQNSTIASYIYRQEVINNKNNQIGKEIDQEFFEFDKNFDMNKEIKNTEDAKIFCKNLKCTDNKNKLFFPYETRNITTINQLSSIIENFPNQSKFAVWLLIETAITPTVKKDVREFAKLRIIELLNNPNVNSYPKYRIFHHLSRNSDFKLDKFTKEEINSLVKLATTFIKENEYELKIISYFFLMITRYNDFDFKKNFKKDKLMKLKQYPKIENKEELKLADNLQLIIVDEELFKSIFL